MARRDFKVSEYILGGLGACGACLFTNPLEVVKTRMQLQGELLSRGTYSRHYKNVFHAFYTVGKYDGIVALQKGLIPGLWYQLFMNGARLGIYQTMVNFGVTRNANGDISLPKSVVAGAISGCVGSTVGSPFYLVKTHLQALSDQKIAVGHQHKHPGMLKAFQLIVSREGIPGLWRGVTGAMARVSVGSAAQLSTFSKCKDMVEHSQVFSPGSLLIPFVASMAGGVVVVCFMTPFDVISTRLYNQGVDANGRGLYYKGVLDCFWKILTKEGPFGFYKGWSASWFRLAPHTVLSLVFWDQLRTLYESNRSKSGLRS